MRKSQGAVQQLCKVQCLNFAPCEVFISHRAKFSIGKVQSPGIAPCKVILIILPKSGVHSKVTANTILSPPTLRNRAPPLSNSSLQLQLTTPTLKTLPPRRVCSRIPHPRQIFRDSHGLSIAHVCQLHIIPLCPSACSTRLKEPFYHTTTHFNKFLPPPEERMRI